MIREKLKRHPDRLVPSDQDMVSLCVAVADNYNGLLSAHRRIKGTDLLIPNEMESARQLVVRLVERYKLNDLRHNESEKKALRALAQWTLVVNHDLRGQEGNPPIIAWSD